MILMMLLYWSSFDFFNDYDGLLLHLFSRSDFRLTTVNNFVDSDGLFLLERWRWIFVSLLFVFFGRRFLLAFAVGWCHYLSYVAVESWGVDVWAFDFELTIISCKHHNGCSSLRRNRSFLNCQNILWTGTRLHLLQGQSWGDRAGIHLGLRGGVRVLMAFLRCLRLLNQSLVSSILSFMWTWLDVDDFVLMLLLGFIEHVWLLAISIILLVHRWPCNDQHLLAG